MNLSDPRLSPYDRLKLRLGWLFGVRWVGEDEVAVIYESGRLYALFRGPRSFNINPFTQEVIAIINAGPDMFQARCPGIRTRDAVPLDFLIALKYSFAPERSLREITHLVVKLTPPERRAILVLHATNALQKVLPQFTVDEVCRGQVFDEIERRTLSGLYDLVSRLGLEPTRVMMCEVTPPAALSNRFADLAQRRANAHDLAQYEPYELNQVMRAQVIEALSRMSPNRQYIDFPAGLTDAAPGQPPVIDMPPALPQVPGSTDDEEANPRTARPSPPKKRPHSRLGP